MKKLMILAAMLALVLAVAVPALAQVDQGLAERNQSGNVDSTFTVTSSGNDGSQCVTPLQFGNTGSQQNIQGIQQYGSSQGSGQGGRFGGGFSNNGAFGGAELTGPTFTFEPTLENTCGQTVQQSSAASSNQYPVSQPASTPQPPASTPQPPVSSPGTSY